MNVPTSRWPETTPWQGQGSQGKEAPGLRSALTEDKPRASGQASPPLPAVSALSPWPGVTWFSWRVNGARSGS